VNNVKIKTYRVRLKHVQLLALTLYQSEKVDFFHPVSEL